MNYPAATTIQGIKVSNYSLQEILEIVRRELKDKSSKPRVLSLYTINPEFIVLSHELKNFKEILNRAFITVPDGIGIMYAGLLKRKPFQERITGVDLVHSLTQLAGEHDLTVGFLGGKEDAAKICRDFFAKQYPSLQTWSDPGPYLEIKNTAVAENSHNSISKNIKIDQNSYNLPKLLEKIADTDILYVGFGAPKQEYFIEYISKQLADTQTTTNTSQHKESSMSAAATRVIHPGKASHRLVCVGVGGSLDEISGVSAKAPAWIQKVGLKWLFRLATEPWRWRRQLRLLTFIQLLAFPKTESR